VRASPSSSRSVNRRVVTHRTFGQIFQKNEPEPPQKAHSQIDVLIHKTHKRSRVSMMKQNRNGGINEAQYSNSPQGVIEKIGYGRLKDKPTDSWCNKLASLHFQTPYQKGKRNTHVTSLFFSQI
jgi:hypothetical protein